MSSLKTNTDFSKKSRNKLNQLFSELRRLVEPYFSSVSDWNRFRIIDGAIALLTSMPLKQSSFQNNQPAQLSNKEACAFYRNKLNKSFGALKETLISLEITEKLRYHSRAVLLEATIDILSAKVPIRTLPRPRNLLAATRVPKRPLDELYSYTPDEKRPRSIGSTPSPKSSSPDQSPPANVLYNHRLFLEHLRLAQESFQISPFPENSSDFWRPW